MADDTIRVRLIIDDGNQAKALPKKFESVGVKIGKNISKGVTSGIGKVGGILIAALGIRKLTQTFLGFETALAEIRTITQGLGIDNKKLQSTLIGVSAQFGTSAQEQANSFYQIISAGVTDTVKANELLIASNKLAIGGLTTNARAVDILTSAVNSFGQANLSAKRAADILFGIVKLGKTRVEDLSSSLGLILPSAAALKISFEDVGAALAQLTTKGLSTSEAVTQLNAVFTAVLKKQDTAKTLGPKVAKAFSLQALQAKGLTLFLKDLNDALGGSETKLVKLLGRVEGARAIISLAGDNFVGLAEKVKELTNSAGAADAAFQEIDKTVGQQLNITMANLSAIFLNLTIETGGPFATFLKGLNEELQNINSVFKAVGDSGKVLGLILANIALKVAEARLAVREFKAEIAAFFTTASKKTFDEAVLSDKNVAEMKQRIIEIEAAITEALGFNDLPKDENGDVKSPLSDLSKQAKQAAVDVPDALGSIKMGFQDVFAFLNENSRLSTENLEKLAASASKNLRAIGATFARGFAGSFAAVGAALVKGENAFAAFGNAILGVLGDIAIKAGTELVLLGFGFNDPSKVGTGLALITLGGALKAIAGGAGGGGAPAVGGGGAVSGGELEGATFEDAELAEPQTVVNIRIDGVVSDPRGVAQQINDLLQEFSDTNGAVIVQEA